MAARAFIKQFLALSDRIPSLNKPDCGLGSLSYSGPGTHLPLIFSLPFFLCSPIGDETRAVINCDFTLRGQSNEMRPS